MYRKVILIQVDSIIGYPPTLSLINVLYNIGCDLTVITTCVNNSLKRLIPEGVGLVNVGSEYKYSNGLFKKFTSLFSIRKQIWKEIDCRYDDNTLLWIMSNITVKHLGGRLVKYNYNLHLFELIEKICYFNDKFELDLSLKSLAQNANNVIVCEYNRAQITKAWLHLEKLPLVVSNKPMPTGIIKNSEIKHSEEARICLEKLKGRKILLYQGVVDAERPIEPFAKAIEEMGNDFAFVVMTGNDCDYLKKYSKTTLLSYIPAPYHLEVTSNAFIGLLMYTPVYGQFTSPLNSIYCAPNKIYEFSQFGIPMLGNDIPGLKYTIEYNRMGACLESIDVDSIKKAVDDIIMNYGQYSDNARTFYESDRKEIVIKKALEKNC